MMANAATRFCQVSFMPWAGMDSDRRIGGVEMWRASEAELDRRVADVSVRDHLKRYFKCYVTPFGKHTDSIIVCELDTKDFSVLADTDLACIRRAADALYFVATSTQTWWSVGGGHQAPSPSAEQFQLVHQNFRPGNDYIAVESGNVLSGGVPLDTVRFTRPWHVGVWHVQPDKHVLAAVDRLLAPDVDVTTRARFARCFEWFRLAHAGADDVSPFSRVVMMATAFEVLLQVPKDGGKARFFAKAVDKWLSRPEHKKVAVRMRPGARDTIELAPMGIWARDFYDLRSAIVHGDDLAPESLRFTSPVRGDLTHLMVADLVLWECVVRELHTLGLLRIDGDPLKLVDPRTGATEELPSPDLAEIWGDVFLPLIFSLNKLHEALGWLPPRERWTREGGCIGD
jgi:hypothetical protein